MTLVEFIAPLRDAPNRDKCLGIIYYEQRYNGKDSLTVEEVHTALRNARIPRAAKINIADVLAKSGHYVDSSGVKGQRRLWKLTESGQQRVRTLLGLPEAEPELEHDAATLEALASKISDTDVRGYVEEAIKCLKVGALRAAIVFLWTGTIRTLQEVALKKPSGTLNAAISKHDPKARTVSKIEDFAYLKDATTLLALQELGILDKGEKQTLEEGLNLRNRCGHPTSYKPGVKKASSFIEDILGIAF